MVSQALTNLGFYWGQSGRRFGVFDIICPGCETVYTIPADRIGPMGRKVRCARCGVEWRAKREEPAAVAEEQLPESINAGIEASIGPTIEAMIRDEIRPPETAEAIAADSAPVAAGGVATVAAEPVAATGQSLAVAEPTGIQAPSQLPAPLAVRREKPGVIDGVPAAFARPPRPTRVAPRVVRRKHSKGSSGNNLVGVAVFAVALAMLGGAVALRAPIVSAVPNLARLYQLVGLPINLRGLEFKSVVATRDIENGNPVLIIQGQIANVAGKELSLPAVRIALRNSGHEVYAWLVEASRSQLSAGDTLPFKARLASPPANADDLTLRFADRAPAKVVQR